MVRQETPTCIRQRSFVGLVAFALLTLGGWGCGNPSTRPSTPAGQPIVTTSDESLTSEEYIRLGMAAHDRDWSAADMVKAEQVLASLAPEGHRQLPRYQSERSGKVLAQLTSAHNLDQFRKRGLPLGVRFPAAINYMQATNQVFKLYLAAFLKNEVRDSEMVELMGALLRSTAVVVELVDEFLPTIKKDDPKYQVRMRGLEQMKRGLASTVAGGLQTLTERQSYRGSELVRLVRYMRDTFPVIVPRLPPGARTETLLRLEKMQEDQALKDLQPGLGELYVKVKASVAKEKAP